MTDTMANTRRYLTLRAIGAFVVAACVCACGSDSPGSAALNEESAGLRGKRLYLDGGRLVGTGVSCVDCHGDVIGSAFALGKAANNSTAIDYAINAVPQMARSRGHYSAQQLRDLATYIGDPSVPSPDLRLMTRGPAANPFTTERLEFAATLVGSAPSASTARLINVGQREARITNQPTLTGPDASQFDVVTSDCVAGMVLATAQGCEVSISLRATGATRLRTASLQIGHDWIGGAVNIALIGSSPVNP